MDKNVCYVGPQWKAVIRGDIEPFYILYEAVDRCLKRRPDLVTSFLFPDVVIPKNGIEPDGLHAMLTGKKEEFRVYYEWLPRALVDATGYSAFHQKCKEATELIADELQRWFAPHEMPEIQIQSYEMTAMGTTRYRFFGPLTGEERVSLVETLVEAMQEQTLEQDGCMVSCDFQIISADKIELTFILEHPCGIDSDILNDKASEFIKRVADWSLTIYGLLDRQRTVIGMQSETRVDKPQFGKEFFCLEKISFDKEEDACDECTFE